ncbi:MAG: PAS domain S-box protein, partial [Anaerolineales bacterium]
MTAQRGTPQKSSLTIKVLMYFGVIVVITFAFAFLLLSIVIRTQIQTLLKTDLQQVLTAISTGVNAEMLLDLAEKGEPNAAGFSNDPRYLELIHFLDQIHQAEPDAWPYLYIPGDSPNEVFLVVDLISLYEPEKAAGFMEANQSNSGYVLIGLERQTFREVDAQFILMIRKWGAQTRIPWLRDGLDHLADWLAGLGIFPKQEFGVYEDKYGRWASGYMPIVNLAGERVAAVGVDFKADLIEEEYQKSRRLVFAMLLAALIVPVIFFLFLIKRVINPIRELNQIAQKIWEDDHSNQDTFRNFRKVRSYDELDSLADVLQDMVEKLRQRERRYQAVIDAQDSLILRTSPEGKFTFSNQAYDALRGNPEVSDLAEVTGNGLHPDDQQEALRFLQEEVPRITKEDPIRKHETRLYDHEGNLKWYLWTITGIFNGQGKLTEFQGVGQDITELKGIQQELEQANNRLREISHELFNAAEQERNKIAREVHDDMLNYISELVMDLKGDIPAERVNQNYQLIADRLRETVYNLRPPMLAYGLSYGLKDYVHTLTDRMSGEVAVNFNLTESDASYPMEVDVHLFRIVQQACENAVEHALPKNITITADLQPGRVRMAVEDDGLGFEWNYRDFIDESVGQNRFGLAGMFERGLIVGARVRIRSEEGVGTRVEIT